MIEDLPKRGGESGCVDLSHPFDDQAPLLDWLYAQSQAGRWKISRERFAAVLERSAKKTLSPGTVTPQKLQEYLNALHLEDLALATACADGSEIAWEHFFATYRAYLRSAAAAILRCSAGSAEACDLADSLFSELYGLADGKGSERSLFRYFHGRSTLKTWLRAVLAQRHIDTIRAGRRFEHRVEDILRQGIGAANGSAVQPGLSDAEIALCFEYSAGETPIDLDKLLPRAKSPGPAAGKPTP